jgi:hypothetical protein
MASTAENDEEPGSGSGGGHTNSTETQIDEPGSLDDISQQIQQDPASLTAPRDPAFPGEISSTVQYEDIDLEELSAVAKLDHIKQAMEFIRALENASLDDRFSKLGPKALQRLRNPPTSPADIASPDLRLGLDLFLSTINSSQQTYTDTRRAILRRHPDDDIPTYSQIKSRIVEITGVESTEHDMCIKSCLAYTGPFTELSACPECGESRYDSVTKKTRQTFHTMLLGPQLQALWRDRESAERMLYRRRITAMILELLEANGGILPSYDDYFYGSDYIEAVRSGQVQDKDMVLMLSLDGAQLYRYKQSDCWIYIWIIMDLAPGIRYKKKYVLIGAIIPGPHKPKIVDSYLFPGLHHFSALQKEGLPIWDAFHNVVEISHLFFALGTADGPGMTYLNGLVGHHGKNGCRLYCSAVGRHKPGISHYYPAFYKPHNYDVEGCSHEDYSYEKPPIRSPEFYEENLRYLMASPNERQYKKRRLETGISKPSIFLGLNPQHKVAIPLCFGSDIMHLESLNIPDLLIPLWRGTFDCDKNDSRSDWPWAVLHGQKWEEHGRDVAAATPYLPGSFDRPPRNPAEKISSGYKAWEFLLYLYGLGPGVFFNILPQTYYKHFCKLVFAVRIINQHQIKTKDLKKAHQALVEFAHEFELLYYQRRTDRLHFVRQSIHALTHLALEVIRLGPLICSSQWTMERTIGNLGEEIRSHVHPYANLSQRGLQRCQINALKAMFPDLEESEDKIPRGAKDLGNGYVLLRAREETAKYIEDAECRALKLYLQDTCNIHIPQNWSPKISRWARLRLPNGQVARSAWKEKLKPLEKVRMARNVTVRFPLASLTMYNE